MLKFNMTRALRSTIFAAASVVAVLAHAAGPKIAVTDLSYEEKVQQYFQHTEYKATHSASSSQRENYRDSDFSSSGRASGHSQEKSDVAYKSTSGSQTYIDRGEMRKFTADIKGELLKSGYRLVQGKPWTQQNTEKLYDIINRIKQGYYPGADYVLWGSINNVEFRREDNPIQGSSATSHSLALELVGEFSLINTKTYEIKAAFSAMGEGSDVKMTDAAGTMVTLNRSKVMQEVSRSLGEAVAREVEGQFSAGASTKQNFSSSRTETVVEEKTVIFK